MIVYSEENSSRLANEILDTSAQYNCYEILFGKLHSFKGKNKD